MKNAACFALAVSSLALVGAAPAKRPSATVSVSAKLFNAQGKEEGKATLFQRGKMLHLVMYVQKQTPGYHGIHVHMTGLCTPPDFTKAGPHWNPGKKQHGRENPMGAHAGDVENIRVEADGVGKLHSTIGEGSLLVGPDRLMDSDGASLIFHETADDFTTDPSGNSGKRILCGVFSHDQM